MIHNIHNTTDAIMEYYQKINAASPTESQQRKETPDKDDRTEIIY
jgi:hypothetical protein